MREFQSTTAENFQSWDRFLRAYYDPIRAALEMMTFVGPDRADDVAHTFFLKLHRIDLLSHRPALTGRFRDWLYVAARNHALDEWRKERRRKDREGGRGRGEAVGPREEEPFDADACYALSVLHLTISRVRRHLLREGKAQHWMIFEELALAPLVPGRVSRTRAELLAMFPGEGPGFLDNRMTTVKRVFRRLLPASIPVDPSESRTAEERFDELLAILGGSARTRLWLAFLVDPDPGPPVPDGSSVELTGVFGEPGGSADDLGDELRVLLSFWLERPLHEIPDDRGEPSSSPSPSVNLRALLGDEEAPVPPIPPEELTAMLERLKSFAKRVHRSRPDGRGRGRIEDALPFEVAQMLYNLAGALAMVRCDARIIGLNDEAFRKNLAWALRQPWVDPRILPVLAAAMERLRV